jgi:restriction endonuclease Mrr
VEYVRGLAQKIVLIDGKRLAALMIEYNVGVQPDQSYTLQTSRSILFR